jgi:hypothetical protein
MQRFETVECQEVMDVMAEPAVQIEMCEGEHMAANEGMYVVKNPVVVDEMMSAPKMQDMEGMDMEGEHEAAPMGRDVTDVPIEDLVPCFAAGCCIFSLFCKCPDSFGCNQNCAILCFQTKYVCCKCLNPKENEDRKCCNLTACNAFCLAPTKFFEVDGAFCCFDTRCAFPCTPKTPCLFTVCPFVVCCADFKFVGFKACNNVGQLIPRILERQGKAETKTAPAQQTVIVQVNNVQG